MISLFVFILICFISAGIGSILTQKSVKTWYKTIQKPSWTPPNWLFAPVWSILYLMMAISVWLIWNKSADFKISAAVILFFAQLLLNIAWSAIFFALRSISWAAIEIVLLWIMILATIISFWPIDHLAAMLLIPYLLWSTFAGILTWTIWRMNWKAL